MASSDFIGALFARSRLCFACWCFDFHGGNYARFARDDLAVGIEIEIRLDVDKGIHRSPIDLNSQRLSVQRMLLCCTNESDDMWRVRLNFSSPLPPAFSSKWVTSNTYRPAQGVG